MSDQSNFWKCVLTGYHKAKVNATVHEFLISIGKFLTEV